MQTQIPESCYLKDAALELIQNRSVKLPLKQIAEDTGIAEAWLSLFAKDRIKEPGVIKVQILYEYLSGNKLEEIIANKK